MGFIRGNNHQRIIKNTILPQSFNKSCDSLIEKGNRGNFSRTIFFRLLIGGGKRLMGGDSQKGQQPWFFCSLQFTNVFSRPDKKIIISCSPDKIGLGSLGKPLNPMDMIESPWPAWPGLYS